MCVFQLDLGVDADDSDTEEGRVLGLNSEYPDGCRWIYQTIGGSLRGYLVEEKRCEV